MEPIVKIVSERIKPLEEDHTYELRINFALFISATHKKTGIRDWLTGLVAWFLLSLAELVDSIFVQAHILFIYHYLMFNKLLEFNSFPNQLFFR